MLRLRDIMTKDVLTVDPEMSIRDAMEFLSMHCISGVPVVAGARIVGLISASDLLWFASQLPGVPVFRGSSDDNEPTGDESVERCEDEDDSRSYFVNMWQAPGADTSAMYASSEGPEWNRLEEHTVSEAMTTRRICTLPPIASIQAAAEYMQRESIHRILVVENEQLVGIVSVTDVARAAASSIAFRRTVAFPADRGHAFVPSDGHDRAPR
jgi:CBS domain-containing protein